MSDTSTLRNVNGDLKAHEISVGETIYFSDAAKGQKHKRFKKGIVRELYHHHIVVEVIPTMPRATKGYMLSLGRTSINCGDCSVRRHINASEAVRYEDLVAE